MEAVTEAAHLVKHWQDVHVITLGNQAHANRPRGLEGGLQEAAPAPEARLTHVVSHRSWFFWDGKRGKCRGWR